MCQIDLQHKNIMFWGIFVLVSAVKLLFLPAYRSTDFEVHRNWLAITHSLPLSKWYFEETSEWTLDYPPFFAYFEWALSHVAKFFDPNMLNVNNLNYSSFETILFQRLSVIFTDIVYAIGVKRCVQQLSSNKSERFLLAMALLSNFGLLIIDHIHFQYNGILFGILLISISFMLEDRFLCSAFFFAVLLNMKHIFVYISPIYIVYLLKVYCWQSESITKALTNLTKLAVITVGVMAISFGPFYTNIPQVFSRLFPFKRGLCHAYWAPNFWAIYNMIDKIASIAFKKAPSTSSNTGGLVQEYEHQYLPVVRPIATFVLTFVAILPCILKIAFSSQSRATAKFDFIRGIVICGLSSFMFGWHVHEKAILLAFIPLSLLLTQSSIEAKQTLFLSMVANYSLFPLLFTANLLVIKSSLFLLYTLIIAYGIHSRNLAKGHRFILSWPEIFYVVGLVGVFMYDICLQYVFKLDSKLPFLPLLLTSVYCSIGVTYFWLSYYIMFLLSRNAIDSKTKHAKEKIK